jgi:hypothetical protein
VLFSSFLNDFDKGHTPGRHPLSVFYTKTTMFQKLVLLPPSGKTGGHNQMGLEYGLYIFNIVMILMPGKIM